MYLCTIHFLLCEYPISKKMDVLRTDIHEVAASSWRAILVWKLAVSDQQPVDLNVDLDGLPGMATTPVSKIPHLRNDFLAADHQTTWPDSWPEQYVIRVSAREYFNVQKRVNWLIILLLFLRPPVSISMWRICLSSPGLIGEKSHGKANLSHNSRVKDTGHVKSNPELRLICICLILRFLSRNCNRINGSRIWKSIHKTLYVSPRSG